MRRFARVELADDIVPDETTLLRLGHLLRKRPRECGSGDECEPPLQAPGGDGVQLRCVGMIATTIALATESIIALAASAYAQYAFPTHRPDNTPDPRV